MLTKQQVETVALVDSLVKAHEEAGADDMEILADLVSIPELHTLIASLDRQDMDILLEQYDGFAYFLTIVEEVAGMIHDGTIPLPPLPDSGVFVNDALDPSKLPIPPNAGKRPQESGAAPILPRLTANRTFMEDLMAEDAPCFALGMVEEQQETLGFMVLRPGDIIPPQVLQQGFRFGHCLLGDDNHEVLQFVFGFYGHGNYNVLVNPNDPLVQAVLDRMLETGDYLFFALGPDNQVMAYRASLEEDLLCYIREHIDRIRQSGTTEEQYADCIEKFARTPTPPGTLLHWVCRSNLDYLDLSKNRLELTPAAV